MVDTEIKNRVYEYIHQNPKKSDEEIAEALNLSLPVVVDAVLQLRNEGRIAEAT